MKEIDKPILTIRFANEADNVKLTEFRVSQFKTAKEFELLNPALLSLQKGLIYIIEQDGIIISTMQVEIV
jgi:hypothetical protein